MRYMLDTNMIIYARNNRPEIVLEMFKRHRIEDMCLSAITLAELEYGIRNSRNYERNHLALMTLLSGLVIMPFDETAAEEYGTIRSRLKKEGTMIGANDLLIADHARSRDLILVTNNTREFERVEGLKLENWTLEQ